MNRAKEIAIDHWCTIVCGVFFLFVAYKLTAIEDQLSSLEWDTSNIEGEVSHTRMIIEKRGG